MRQRALARFVDTGVVFNVPLVTNFKADPFDIISLGDRLRVDGGRGLVTLL